MTGTERREYVFETCLGRGGFGEVYRARVRRASGFETVVAVKVLRPDVDPTSQAALRLRDEARVLGIVRHHAIPVVHDLVVLDGRLALVVAYVEGEDLSRCVRGAEPPPPRAVAEICATVADALHAAYHARLPGGRAAHIVHRDLKPANVRVGRDGTANLLDFGIAWTDALARSAQTQTAALVGSPVYMPPERYDGAPPEPAQDVFALSAVLFESLVRDRLFRDHTFHTLAGLALSRERFDAAVERRLVELPSGLPPALTELVRLGLSWMPDERPTAEAMARGLELLVPHLPGASLGAWCRTRAWPEVPPRDGPWVGRVVTEDDALPELPAAPVAAEDARPAWRGAEVDTRELTTSLALEPLTPTPALPLEPEAAPAGRRGWAAVLALAAVALVGIGAWTFTPDAPVAASPPPAPAAIEPVRPVATAPLPPPVAEPPARTEPAPTPEPAAARKVRGPAPVRIVPEVVSHPEPEPVPVPVAAPRVEPVMAAVRPPPVEPAPPTGTLVEVHADSEVPDVLVETPTGIVPLPTRLAAGRYTVLVPDLAGRPQIAGAIAVPASGRVRVRCAMGLCRGVP